MAGAETRRRRRAAQAKENYAFEMLHAQSDSAGRVKPDSAPDSPAGFPFVSDGTLLYRRGNLGAPRSGGAPTTAT